MRPPSQDSAIFAHFADSYLPSGPPRGDCSGRQHPARVPVDGENTIVDLARFGWLATVLVCLIAVVILGLQGYFGYAGVTLAVAVSAAINLR